MRIKTIIITAFYLLPLWMNAQSTDCRFDALKAFEIRLTQAITDPNTRFFKESQISSQEVQQCLDVMDSSSLSEISIASSKIYFLEDLDTTSAFNNLLFQIRSQPVYGNYVATPEEHAFTAELYVPVDSGYVKGRLEFKGILYVNNRWVLTSPPKFQKTEKTHMMTNPTGSFDRCFFNSLKGTGIRILTALQNQDTSRIKEWRVQENDLADFAAYFSLAEDQVEKMKESFDEDYTLKRLFQDAHELPETIDTSSLVFNYSIEYEGGSCMIDDLRIQFKQGDTYQYLSLDALIILNGKWICFDESPKVISHRINKRHPFCYLK
jgi:hypothetical protein